MPADYNLLQPTVRLNTPFENLGQVLQVRNQQEAARGLREQREAIAEQRRAQTDKIQRETAEADAVRALYTRVDPASGQPKPPTREELSGVIGPESATKIFDGFEALTTKTNANRTSASQRLASIAGGVLAWPEADRPRAYQDVLKGLLADGTVQPGQAPETYSEPWVRQIQRAALSAKEQADIDEKSAPPRTVTPGQGVLNPATGKYEVPLPVTEKPAALGSASDFVAKWAADRKLDPSKLSAAQTAAAVQAHARASQAPSQASANEPLVAVMGPDNQPVLVPRSQAAGKRPASNREQGRPVTSGDAGRIADLDTSLDDLEVLANTLGTTGAGSKIGAMLPNVVSEVTGWGLDSKSRQGTIDRVKQVIGKALEGGVLRKEDEIKYEKILPTIGDPPEVAKTKLEGLKKALVLRRQTTLDALKDAGYETTAFEQRTGQRGGDGGMVDMVAPDGRALRVPQSDVQRMLSLGAKKAGG